MILLVWLCILSFFFFFCHSCHPKVNQNNAPFFLFECVTVIYGHKTRQKISQFGDLEQEALIWLIVLWVRFGGPSRQFLSWTSSHVYSQVALGHQDDPATCLSSTSRLAQNVLLVEKKPKCVSSLKPPDVSHWPTQSKSYDGPGV